MLDCIYLSCAITSFLQLWHFMFDHNNSINYRRKNFKTHFRFRVENFEIQIFSDMLNNHICLLFSRRANKRLFNVDITFTVQEGCPNSQKPSVQHLKVNLYFNSEHATFLRQKRVPQWVRLNPIVETQLENCVIQVQRVEYHKQQGDLGNLQ